MVDSRWVVKLSDFGLEPILLEMRQQKAIELEQRDERMDGNHIDLYSSYYY